MRDRCYNPNNRTYKNYGGRGIKVCEEWKDFQKFYDDMGTRPSSRHSLDKIDVDGDYELTNCRWSLPKVQANNRQIRKSIRAWTDAELFAEVQRRSPRG